MRLKEQFENRKRHKLWQIFIPRSHKVLKLKYFTILNQAFMNGLSGPFHKKFILCGTGILPVLENGTTSQLP